MPDDAKTDERYKQTAGWKRNNPGNLMVQSIPYWGKATVQEKGGPVTFVSMAAGLRALARDLRVKSQSITTIKGIIEMYAPSYENNTADYIAYVAKATGKTATQPLTFDDPTFVALVNVIVKMEIGYGTCPFTDVELQAAVDDAKVSK
jgi:hypothetical protein